MKKHAFATGLAAALLIVAALWTPAHAAMSPDEIYGEWAGTLVFFPSGGQTPRPATCELKIALSAQGELRFTDSTPCTALPPIPLTAQSGVLKGPGGGNWGTYDSMTIAFKHPALPIDITISLVSDTEIEYRETVCSDALPRSCTRLYGILTRK